MPPSTPLRENRGFASELKFLVTIPLGSEIVEWARARLSPDPHTGGEEDPTYRIASLYFDTDRFDVFHRKGSYGRSKYRIRRYGPSEVAYLERKLKTRGNVSKRRSAVGLDELKFLDRPEKARKWPGYWYHQRLLVRQLKPVCEIAYRRTALVSTNAYGAIRLTLDNNIRAHSANGMVFNGVSNGLLLSEDRTILELKFRREVPVLFKQLVEEFRLNPQPFSKYRAATSTLGLAGTSNLNAPSSDSGSNGSACLNS